MTKLNAQIPLDRPPRRARRFREAVENTRREEAQSLVELALLMPLFLIILLGSAEFARFAWAAVLTSNAARAGAAWGSVNPQNATNATGGIQTAAAAESVNLPGLVATSSISCYCAYGKNTNGLCSNPDPQSFCVDATGAAIPLVDYITVNTTSTVTVFGHQFTAKGQSTMVIAP
jgi:hypothetical protein